MNFLIEALDEALKRFGTYSYQDKGPDGVMDVTTLVQRLCDLSPEGVRTLLGDLLTHEHGEHLYDTLWSRLIEDAEHPCADELDAILKVPGWLLRDQEAAVVAPVLTPEQLINQIIEATPPQDGTPSQPLDQ